MRRWVIAVCVLVACGGGDRPILVPPDAPPPPIEPSDDVPAWFGAGGEARIAGRVHGAAPGATLHLRLDIPDPRPWRGRDVALDASGAFDLGPLPRGRYQLLVTGAGLASRVVPVDSAAAPADDVDIFAYPCRTVGSRVRDLRTQATIAGAAIELAGVELTRTDTMGEYEVCVTQEDVLVAVRARGYASALQQLSVAPFASRIELAPERFVRRRIVDRAGRPLAGALVYASRARSEHAPPEIVPLDAVTDPAGRFALATDDEAYPGTIRALVAGVEHWLEDSDGDTLTLGQPTRRIPDGPLAIRGRVLSRGEPVADALVTVYVITPYREGMTRTDRDGRFEVRFHRDSRARLYAEHLPTGVAGHATARAGGDVTIEVAPMGTIELLATDVRGVRVDDVSAYVDDVPLRPFFRSAMRGRYAATAPPGRYQIEVIARLPRGHARPTVDVEPGEVATVRVVIGGPRELAGVVVDEAGQPVPGALVRPHDGYVERHATTSSDGRFAIATFLDHSFDLRAATRDGRIGEVDDVHPGDPPVRIVVRATGAVTAACAHRHELVVYTDDREYDGRCGRALRGIPPGRYRYLVLAGEVAVGTVEVRAGETTTIAPTPVSRVSLGGRVVTYPAGAPLTGVECTPRYAVHDNAFDAGRAGTSDEDGRFTLEGVVAAEVRIGCDDRVARYLISDVTIDAANPPRDLVIRAVDTDPDAIPVAIELREARITGLGDEPRNAGLRLDDELLAVDDTPLAGLSDDAIRELAFRGRRGRTVRWHVVGADGRRRAVRFTFPRRPRSASPR